MEEQFEREAKEGWRFAADAAGITDERASSDVRAKKMQQEREEVYAVLQYAASFHCLMEQWKDCEELKPKPKENGISWKRKGKKRGIERSGVVMPTSIDL